MNLKQILNAMSTSFINIQTQKYLYTAFLKFLLFDQQLQLRALCKKSQVLADKSLYTYVIIKDMYNYLDEIDWYPSNKYTMKNGYLIVNLLDRRTITVSIKMINLYRVADAYHVIELGRNFGIKISREVLDELHNIDDILSKLRKDIDLSDMGLTEIPYGARFIESGLNLSCNQIEKITNIDSLRHNIDLSANSIDIIHGLENIITGVNLSYNKITKIQGLQNLISNLDISENEITVIENLPNLVSDLDISYNQIEIIQNLPNLEFGLTIDRNTIDSIDSKTIPKLTRKVSIVGCHLKDTVGLERIRSQLNLGSNFLNNQTLSGLKCIESGLDLGCNRLCTIPENIAKTVKYDLDLSYNQIIHTNNDKNIQFACISNLDLTGNTCIQNVDFPHLTHGLNLNYSGEPIEVNSSAILLKTGTNKINLSQIGLISRDIECLSILNEPKLFIQMDKLRVLSVHSNVQNILSFVNDNKYPLLEDLTIQTNNINEHSDGDGNYWNYECSAQLTNLCIKIAISTSQDISIQEKTVLSLNAPNTKNIKVTSWHDFRDVFVGQYYIIGGTETLTMLIGVQQQGYIQHFGHTINLTTQVYGRPITILHDHTSLKSRFQTINALHSNGLGLQLFGEKFKLAIYNCRYTQVIAPQLKELIARDTMFTQIVIDSVTNAYLENITFNCSYKCPMLQKMTGKSVTFNSMLNVANCVPPFDIAEFKEILNQFSNEYTYQIMNYSIN